MNLNFNHFDVNDEAAAKALKKYFAHNNCVRDIQRLILGLGIYICAKVIITQRDEIEKLKEEKNNRKGD